jgi:hypothetical protein
MNKFKKILINALSLSLLLFAGCSDVLDKKELNNITEKDVWSSVSNATAYLDAIVNRNMPGWPTEISSDCDEAGPDRFVSSILFGRLTNNPPSGNFQGNYAEVRLICSFLEGLEAASFDDATKGRLKAQALVAMAYRYFSMVNSWGGVPLVLHTQKLSDDLLVKRNKTSECFDAIVGMLDEAIAVPDADFPYRWTGNDLGRMSKAVALALKGRILLHWASPRFNPNNSQDRWQAAYDANKTAKERLAQNGYKLFEDFAGIFAESNEMNDEAVYVKRYSYPGGPAHNRDAGTRPYQSVLQFNGLNMPTWELVRSFPMMDGRTVDEATDLYNETLFFKNRDPRFYASIVWNSAVWELYGETGRRQWTYNEPSYPSLSHFYCRKAVQTQYNMEQAPANHNSNDWIEIRYAEVMINYAEAAAETGKNDEAYAMLKEIRQRAGILPGSAGMYGLKANMSKAEMINAIMLERKIEFAFEGKRFEDLRRRKLFSELNGSKRHGRLPVRVLLNGMTKEEFDAIIEAGTADFENDYATYFNDEIVEIDEYIIDFKDNYYFYPIHPDDLYRNSNLEQTTGWEGGTFDPLL